MFLNLITVLIESVQMSSSLTIKNSACAHNVRLLDACTVLANFEKSSLTERFA